jgi:hypothetical protein
LSASTSLITTPAEAAELVAMIALKVKPRPMSTLLTPAW